MMEHTGSLNSSCIGEQLEKYRRMNDRLQRKIKLKDIKIQQLFGYIDDFGKQVVNPEVTPAQKQVGSFTDCNKREKENSTKNNIFKSHNHNLISRRKQSVIKLPALDAGRQLSRIGVISSELGKANVIKIPLTKLKALNASEVKRRFLLKHQLLEPEQQD